ncbi:Pkinase-domain-containing protein [Coprinopsis sp. MPI-PUGE-AT-0042]|nr:Pkinase-domain-containing protein [Coprinopsis sp. MPI-PUGE-AT-0042]
MTLTPVTTKNSHGLSQLHARALDHPLRPEGHLSLNVNIPAALIENTGERKKTICGTPSYIAQGVLFDPANGLSFEVDIWPIEERRKKEEILRKLRPKRAPGTTTRLEGLWSAPTVLFICHATTWVCEGPYPFGTLISIPLGRSRLQRQLERQTVPGLALQAPKGCLFDGDPGINQPVGLLCLLIFAVIPSFLFLARSTGIAELYAEIKIHKFLGHPNIVTFLDCFEDEDNVYITLELCPSGSLMDMLRRRRRFTEPKTRFFMLQLIGACNYMHAHQVIHRDLKLGNLFLDANMNVKVGDFGLAALIENPGERKKAICGTPSYIAPEIVEVDIWSIGVILYTLVVGRPPFQTKEVKDIYKRIRDNEYEFPIERPVTSAARSLIQGILAPDPSQRPTLHEIVDAQFFTQGPVPAFIPTSAHDAPPDFRHITRSASDTNLRRLRRSVLLDVELGSPAHLQQQARDIAARVHGHLRAQEDASAARIAAKDLGGAAGQPHASAPPGRHTGRDAPLPPLPAPPRNIATSVAQQEKEFQKAVQPGSPISALLSSARQPLLVGPTATGAGAGAVGGGVRESPLGRRSVTRGANGVIVEEDEDAAAEMGNRRPSGSRQNTLGRAAGTAPAAAGNGFMTAQKMMSRLEEEEAREERQRQKELEAQKARIVAQMAPVREEADELSEQLDRLEEDEAEEGESQEYVSAEEGDDVPEEAPRGGHEPLKPAARRLGAREQEREEAEAREGEAKEKERERRARAPAAPRRERERVKDKENVPVASSSRVPGPSSKAPMASSSKPTVDDAPAGGPDAPKPNSFDAAAQILMLAFDARAVGKVFKSPMRREDVPEERVFIVSWVDYCNKYGMGYALTDGSVGVHFNDSGSLVLSAEKEHFDYITSRRHGTIYVRKPHTLTSYPEELKSKVYLLKHFEKYIMERLYGEYNYTFEDTERSKGMEWVQKYLRMKRVIVFKLSHDVLQFNFYDHSKLILSSNGLLITYIDKSYNLTRWTLQDVMAFSLNPPSDASEDEQKFNQKLVDKLKYCKEVLISIKTASAGGEDGEATAAESGKESNAREGKEKERDIGEAPRGTRERERAPVLNKRASRMVLR